MTDGRGLAPQPGPAGVRLGIIGMGWVGTTRARTAAADGHVRELHLADIVPDRAERAAAETRATSFTADYTKLLGAVDAVIISAAPETTHYPIARDCLLAGKHVLLEKPMALTLDEADDLVSLAETSGATFTVGYTQRFQPKFVFIREQFGRGELGRPTSIMISRHITRELGAKIASRGALGPVQMEATHDIDLALWWLHPRRPVRVYAQAANGIMLDKYAQPDCVWIVITMEDGVVVAIGADWSLPTESPGYSSVMAEVVGTGGAVFSDGSHRDLLVSTTEKGILRPLSTMPGEPVGVVYEGPMEAETKHFIQCAATGASPVVTPGQARLALEVALAADLSAQQHLPVSMQVAHSGAELL